MKYIVIFSLQCRGDSEDEGSENGGEKLGRIEKWGSEVRGS